MMYDSLHGPGTWYELRAPVKRALQERDRDDELQVALYKLHTRKRDVYCLPFQYTSQPGSCPSCAMWSVVTLAIAICRIVVHTLALERVLLDRYYGSTVRRAETVVKIRSENSRSTVREC